MIEIGSKMLFTTSMTNKFAKIWTRKTPNMDNFHVVRLLKVCNYQRLRGRINHLILKWSSERLFIDHCKRVVKAAKLFLANNTKECYTLQKLSFHGFWQMADSASNKVNLLYFLYLMVLNCYLLHLARQCCFVKSFLRTPSLMTHVFLYLLSFLELMWNCLKFS